MWNTVLFDLDGTLTDSGEGITKCVQYALLKEFGIRVENHRDLAAFVGPPLKEQFMHYAGLTPEEGERAVRAYRERYTAKGIYENRLYDGIGGLLARLSAEGFTLAVTSSKPTVFCEEVLRYFGIRQYFTLVLGSELSGERVRKAEVIEEALQRLGRSDGRDGVVIVGDRNYDVLGAKEAGISSIGVTYGYGSRAELEEAWPDCIVDSPAELRNVLIGQKRAALSGTRGGAADGAAGAPAQGPAGRGGFPRAESVPFRIWRVIYPILIDQAGSFGVYTAVGAAWLIFCFFSGKDLPDFTAMPDLMSFFTRNLILLTGLVDGVLIPVMYLLFRGDERERAGGRPMRRGLAKKALTPAACALTVLFTLTSVTVVNAVFDLLLSLLPKEDAAYGALAEALGAAPVPVVLLSVCVIGPVLEELLFRGLIYRRVRDYAGVPAAVLISAASFGIIHGNITQGLIAGTFGIVLALLYEHYGNLTVPVIAHIANNLYASFIDAGDGGFFDVLLPVLCLAAALGLGYLIFFRDEKVNAL